MVKRSRVPPLQPRNPSGSQHAEIDHRPVGLVIRQGDGEPFDALGHVERHFPVMLVVRTGDLAGETKVGLRLLPRHWPAR